MRRYHMHGKMHEDIFDDDKGKWVRYKDAIKEINQLREALQWMCESVDHKEGITTECAKVCKYYKICREGPSENT